LPKSPPFSPNCGTAETMPFQNSVYAKWQAIWRTLIESDDSNGVVQPTRPKSLGPMTKALRQFADKSM
jgi:hypothetical protein